jgi:hypothetical protein
VRLNTVQLRHGKRHAASAAAPPPQTTWERRADSLLFILLGAAVLLNICTTYAYPSLGPDEVWLLSRVTGFLKDGIPFGPVDEASRTPFARYWAPYPIAPVLAYSIPAILGGTESVMPLRVVSVAFMLILLAAMYSIGRTVHGPRLGAACALFGALSHQTMFAGHIVRPDIISVAFAYSGFAVYLAASTRERDNGPSSVSGWFFILPGLLVGTGMLFHLRSVLFVPVPPVVALERHRARVFGRRDVYLYACGLLPPLGAYLAYQVLPSPEAYFKGMQLLLGDSRTPPAYVGPSAAARTVVAFGRYLLEFYGPGAALLPPALVLLALRELRAYSAIVAITAAVTGMSLLLIASPNRLSMVGPAVAIDLFLATASVHLFFEYARRSRAVQRIRTPAVLILLALMVYFNCVRPVRTTLNNVTPQIQFVNAHIKPGDSVLGPHIYWLAARENRFIPFDVVADLGRRGNTDLIGTLRLLRPDILIEDAMTQWYLSDLPIGDPWYDAIRIPRQEFYEILGRVGTIVAKLDLPEVEPVILYRLRWDDQDGDRRSGERPR